MAWGAARERAARRHRWILIYTVGLAAALLSSAQPASAADPVIAAAGDIACSSSSSNFNSGNGTADKCRQKYTSNLLVNQGLAAVLPLGDGQYESGTLSGFRNSYDLSWGRVKSITRPAPGNHEYKTTNASGYFDYFNGTGVANGPAGDRTKGYYSFDVGTWHIIALNSTDHCTIISCASGSAQDTWLKADLAANASKYCTLAFWHDPRFNSGHDGNADEMAPLFQDLYNADADVVLGGHAHDYERFAPQNPSGQLDNARGIRQFVVGTGGAFFTAMGTTKPNSQVRQNNTYGVLKLTLHPTSYDWQFVSESGKTFTDSGTANCHGSTPPPADTTKPTVPGNVTATPTATGTTGTGQVALNWSLSSDNVGVTGYRVFRGTTQVAQLGVTNAWTDTGLAPGPYSYTVRAFDAAGNQSDPSTAANTNVVDGTKPTTPGNPTASASATGTNGTGQVQVSWAAAGDNAGVTGYRIFRGTTQVGSVNGTTLTWTETGLNAGPYSYTVRALDGAGNLSDPSATASATVTDGTNPAIPQNLRATGGPSQVALTWNQSSDNVGVTGYRVYRGGNQVGSTTGSTSTSYTDSPVNAGSYSYTVRAIDAAGNLSDDSTSASATVPDTTKPSIPQNVRATGGTAQVTLTWNASTDDVGVTGYRVFRGTTQLSPVNGTTTSYTDSPLAAGTYSYTVRAIDAAGNTSDPSTPPAGATVPDTTNPTAPTLTASLQGTNQAHLSWTGAIDDVGVSSYDVFRDGNLIANVGASTSTYDDSSLLPGTYRYTVRARDAAGHSSPPSNERPVTVPDLQKPTAPTNLDAAQKGPLAVELNWNAATDNVGVTNYEIYRNGNLIDTIGNQQTYTDNVLVINSYTYEVRALDAAGNRSDASNSDTVTLVAPDGEKPQPPSNLDAQAAGQSAVDLTWTAASDNVLVTQYRIYRDGTAIDTVAPTTSYTDSGVTPGDYSYVVTALDAAGNESDDSNTAPVTVPDTEKPTVPQNLIATANGSVQVDLQWQASTDNVGVAKYRVFRNDQQVAEIDPATQHSDIVLPGDYTYKVTALDAAGNESDPSAGAPVTVYPPDVEKPSAPQNLEATSNGAQVDLTWGAAGDDRGVTQYEVYRDDNLIDTIGATTSYVDHNVAATTTYRYVVKALDAAGNRSDPSNEKSITVPDTEKPTKPTNLQASASATKVDLSWNAASDNVAVTGYTVYRNGSAIATLGAVTSWSDPNVTAPGYDYEVAAVDGAGNVSDRSAKVTATVPDAQKPTQPGTLSATAVGPSQVDLSWGASTDNIGVTGYRIYRNSAPITDVGNVTSYSDTGVTGGNTYTYEVRALDAAGNQSDPTNSAPATTPAASATYTLSADADAKVDSSTPTTNYATANLRTDASGGNPTVESFLRFTVANVPAGSVRSAKLRVYAYTNTVDGPAVYASNPAWTETAINWNNRPPRTSGAAADVANVPSNTWIEYDVTSLVTGNGTYSFDLATTTSDGVDIYPREHANLSLRPQLVVTTGAPDVTKPFPPSGLTANVRSGTQVDLAWQAATDNVGVTGYEVLRNDTVIATLGAVTAYSDTNAVGGSTYTYKVRALDAAGNRSDPSNTQTITTPAAPSIQTFAPQADAEVNAGTPTTNYATAKLRTDADSTPEETFLRFGVTGVSGAVTSAKLRVFAYTGSVDGPAVYTSDPAWTETAINWNNRPARTSTARDDKGSIATNSWVEFDVTPFVTGNGTYSFNLVQTNSDGVDYRSREYTSDRPELIVEAQP